jgi:hypothetical protein
MKLNDHVYIKKIGNLDDHEVWLVDGALVRRDLSDDFTEHGYHARYKFIPQDEVWVEKDTNEEEWKYFLENVDFELKSVAEGKKLEDVENQADEVELRDRRRCAAIRKILDSHHCRKEALRKIRKHRLEKYSNDGLSVWLVDGEIVRGIYRLEYGYGGHDLVYHFIPRNEVWVEEVLDPHERKIILLHEVHERFLMSQEKKDYLHAHEGASIIEMHYRKQSDGLDERLLEEIAKNNF